MKKVVVVILIAVLTGAWVWSYFTGRTLQSVISQEVPQQLESLRQISSPGTTPAVSYQIEEVARNLFVPWSIVFTSPERMLVTERNGAIRVIENGRLQTQPLYRFETVSTRSEEGLMGLVLDPNYQQNKHFYVCLAYPKNNGMVDKVVQLRDDSQTATEVRTVIDDIPAAQFHAGCRLRFGPDGKLYITTGDATNRDLAQDMQSLAGKILRLNADGSIPADNPFVNSPIYSLGHRNPQGLDWHPISQALFATEHGPSGFDGPGGGDEVNVIQPGGNFGWPRVSHQRGAPGLIDPLLVFTPAVAPASGEFYAGEALPQFKHNFLFGMLQGEGIHRVIVDDNAPETVLSHEDIPGIDVGRVREVTEGPDGYIYFSSSNRDGRGPTREGDDKIYRIVPAE